MKLLAEDISLIKQIRASILVWLFIDPHWVHARNGSGKRVQADKGPLRMIYTFPEGERREGFYPCKLEIWHMGYQKKKVLAVRWCGQELEVDRFLRGAWLEPFTGKPLPETRLRVKKDRAIGALGDRYPNALHDDELRKPDERRPG